MLLRIFVLVLSFILTAGFSNQILAEGFLCESPQGYMRLKIFHHTSPKTGGTRKVAVMILSNPKNEFGQRTIGVFHEGQGTLVRSEGVYSARFDLRFKSLIHSPERSINRIARESIRTLSLRPDFDYSQPLEPGEKLTALLSLELRNGRKYQSLINCRRYLKDSQRARERLCEANLGPKLQREFRLF